MKNKMKTIGPSKGIYRVILGIYRDSGKENGNYREYRGSIGLYMDYCNSCGGARYLGTWGSAKP